MLKAAKLRNPRGRWWIKADACDIKSGIRESMDHKWSGDVDMGDGKVEKQHKTYIERLEFISRMTRKDLPDEMEKLKAELDDLLIGIKSIFSCTHIDITFSLILRAILFVCLFFFEYLLGFLLFISQI